MDRDTLYIILNFERIEAEPEILERGYYIPTKNRPKVIHWDKEKAINELFRLQKKFPDKKFLLFEAVSECKPIGDGNEYHLIDTIE